MGRRLDAAQARVREAEEGEEKATQALTAAGAGAGAAVSLPLVYDRGEEVRGLYGFTTDMLEDEDGGSGTWVWPTPTSIILGFPAVELTRFERRRAEQYQQDYLCWLNGERCSGKTRGAYYRLVSKVEVHRRGAAVDPYVYAA